MEPGDQKIDKFEPQNRQESLIVSRLKEKYTFIRRLGKGAFATVYEVINQKLDRHEALKVLSSDLTADQEFLKRFVVEAKICASFTHPNIVTIYEFGRVQNFFYFTMLYVNGPPLSDFLDSKNRLSIKKVCTIIASVAHALDYAHEQGVIHRDIKPQNIMLDKTRRPYITDFGIAKSDKGLTHTRTGLFMGSPHFVSPEQVKGEKVDCRADIYSLGVTLYTLLTQQYPFKGDTAISIMVKRLTEEPISPIQHKPDLDPRLSEIIQKALKKDFNQRYQTAGAFGTELENFLEAKSTTGMDTEVADIKISGIARLYKGVSEKKIYFRTGIVAFFISIMVCLFVFLRPSDSGISGIDRQIGALENRIKQSELSIKDVDGIKAELENLRDANGSNDKMQALFKEVDKKRQEVRLGDFEKKVTRTMADIRKEIAKKSNFRVKDDSKKLIAEIKKLPQKDQAYFQQQLTILSRQMKEAENNINALSLERTDRILQKKIGLAREAFDDSKFESSIKIADEGISIINDSSIHAKKHLEYQLATLDEIKESAKTGIKRRKIANDEKKYNTELKKLMDDVEKKYNEHKYFACINAAIRAKSKIESLPQAKQGRYASEKEKILGFQYRAEHAKERRDSQLFTVKRVDRLIEEGSLGAALSLIDNILVQPDIEPDIEAELKKKREEVQKKWKELNKSLLNLDNIQHDPIVVPPVE